MDNTPPRTRILKGWHLSKKKHSTFLKNFPKYLLMKELDSYCGTIDNTIYAYVKNYHTCSGIFSKPINAGMDDTLGRFEKWHL